MTTIPDSIIITINTSIPGSHQIKFTPNMIDRKISKENDIVYFDPLVKLNKDVIAKVPEQFRVIEFFKKNYFKSLINFHGAQKKKTLEEATEAGYVDNNISILLNILFPEKRILYVNNEPYTIADVQWTKGDWKVDKKGLIIPKTETLKFRNPYTLSKSLNSQTIIGNEQLSKLSSPVAYGSNYVGPQSDLLKKNSHETTPVNPTIPFTQITPATQISASIASKITSTQNVPVTPAPQNIQVNPSAQNIQVNPSAQNVPVTPAAPQSPAPQNIQVNPSAQSPAIQVNPSASEPIQKMSSQTMDDIQYRVNSTYTTELRTLFGRPIDQNLRRFYYMVNELYRNMNYEEKLMVAKIFKNTTSITPTVEKNKNNNISEQGYLENIDNLNVYKSVSDGDCYFDALQQSINIYNKSIDVFEENLEDKITYEIGGILYGSGDNIFTIQCLRQLLVKPIIENKIYYQTMAQTSFLPAINERFKDAIDNLIVNRRITYSEITIQEYNELISLVYVTFNSMTKFFILLPTLTAVPSVDSPSFFEPFTYPKTDKEIEKYVLSKNYWGDQIAITFIQNILDLTTIIIEKNGDKYSIAVPEQVKDISTNGKYVFFYNPGTHYEVISFKYNVPTTLGKRKDRIMTIFENNGKYVPPIAMIIFVFASFYITFPKIIRANFAILNSYLIACNNSFQKIYDNLTIKNEEEYIDFFKYFCDYFYPKSFSLSFNREFPVIINTINNELNTNDLLNGDEDESTGTLIGGSNAYINNNPYRNNPYSNNPYSNNNLYSNNPYSNNPYSNNPYSNNPYSNNNPYINNNPYSNNPYRNHNHYFDSNQYSKPYNVSSSKGDNNRLSYYITIDVELKKGSKISDSEISALKCNQKWNSVRKSFANLTGKKYVIKPIYVQKSNNKTRKNYNYRYNDFYNNNNTRKNYNYGYNDFYNNNNTRKNYNYGYNDFYNNNNTRKNYRYNMYNNN